MERDARRSSDVIDTTSMGRCDDLVAQVHFEKRRAPREFLPFSDEISAISVNLLHQSQSNLEQSHWLHQPLVQSEPIALNAGFSQEVV